VCLPWEAASERLPQAGGIIGSWDIAVKMNVLAVSKFLSAARVGRDDIDTRFKARNVTLQSVLDFQRTVGEITSSAGSPGLLLHERQCDRVQKSASKL